MAKNDKSAGAPADGAANPAAASPAAAAQPGAPVWQLVAQYIKDLSFENPGAPASILSGAGAPTAVNISVQVKKEAEDIYAVEISLAVKAQRDDVLLFNLELVYGGAFRIQNMPEAQLPALLMVECPRMLFPFARQVLANVSQSGGFPPLMMEPVDFGTLYRRNLQAMAEAQKQNETTTKN